jgi:Ca2+-dependent lipid-binding protein
MGSSDPYVKFELEQDNFLFDKNYGRKESTKKQNDCSPEYNETFVWQDMPPRLKNMVLTIRVLDEDYGRDDPIGFATVDLDRLGLSSEPKSVELVVDKKQRDHKGCICCPAPCNWAYKCVCCCFGMLCCCFGPKKAVIFLRISYEE